MFYKSQYQHETVCMSVIYALCATGKHFWNTKNSSGWFVHSSWDGNFFKMYTLFSTNVQKQKYLFTIFVWPSHLTLFGFTAALTVVKELNAWEQFANPTQTIILTNKIVPQTLNNKKTNMENTLHSFFSLHVAPNSTF